MYLWSDKDRADKPYPLCSDTPSAWPQTPPYRWKRHNLHTYRVISGAGPRPVSVPPQNQN